MDMDIAFAGAEPVASVDDPASPSSGLAGRAGPLRGGWSDADTTAPFRRGRPRPAGGKSVIDVQMVDAATLAGALDGLATCVFLVNARAFPVHINAGGRAMLATKDPLRLAHGALAGATRETNRVLNRVLAAATGRRPAGGSSGISLSLTGKDGSHFVVHAMPLGPAPRSGPVDPGAVPVAALFVRETTIDLVAAIEAATQIYDFTPGETRVLRAVIEIGGIPAVASALGLSRPTVKTHLGQLFEKTGSRRQAELVKLIAGFDSPARTARRGTGG